MGFKVNLWNRSPERIEHVQKRGEIELEGEVEGSGVIRLATSNIEEVVEDVDVIMVVLPASAHREVAERLAPCVRKGQTVLLNPGRTGGALEFYHVFKEKGADLSVDIAEAQTFIYVSRHVEPTKAHIFQVKNEVLTAALPAYRTAPVLKVVRQAYPQFIPGTNVLSTGLDNVGAIFHPAVMLLNAARIESTHGDFEYYLEGITPAVAAVLERMDMERCRVAGELGIHAHTAREWLYLAYNSAGRSLYESIQATPGYKGIKAPSHLNHRYIKEDVPMSLVPIASFGRMLRIPTPTIDSIVQLASAAFGVDYWKEGRTVERLGLKGKTVKGIRTFVAGGE